MAFKHRIAPGCEWIAPLVGQITATGSVPQDADIIYAGRNTLSVVQAGGRAVCIKQYKVPIFINRMAYALLRPSKASRAFSNALRLIGLGIATATPYAYIEERGPFMLRRSWFLCEHISNATDLRYIDQRPDYPEIAANIAALMHRLHDCGVWMKDFSCGNILMRGVTDDFVLIDINRMEFGVTSRAKFDRDFSRIVDTEDAVRVIARAYAPDAEPRAIKAFRDLRRRIARKRRFKKLFKPSRK